MPLSLQPDIPKMPKMLLLGHQGLVSAENSLELSMVARDLQAAGRYCQKLANVHRTQTTTSQATHSFSPPGLPMSENSHQFLPMEGTQLPPGG